jgi:hypothetical protein
MTIRIAAQTRRSLTVWVLAVVTGVALSASTITCREVLEIWSAASTRQTWFTSAVASATSASSVV